MGDNSRVTVGELAQGVSETRKAIQRAERFIEQLASAGAKRTSIWVALSDSTLRLRDHLVNDLDELEAALNRELGL
ncbi:MAG TPA: hypothetical protein VHY79_06025 [Rhizomicrobium sp.]|jgi:hypothetical protein|nr:hypothetical protein [Rhizomicrobium sp.]